MSAVATPIRVLVVDDSAFMRTAVTRTLATDPRVEVIGHAKDGQDAVEKVRELRPDVVTMDFNMPRLNGAQAIEKIFEDRPVPVVMLSAHTMDGAKETLQALRAGAVDFVTKPDGEVSTDLGSVRDELLRKIRAAARSRPRASGPPPVVRPVAPKPAPATSPGRISFSSILDPLLIVAVSTGGPAALEKVVPGLPDDFPLGVLVVQHMPAQFTKALAGRLDSISPLRVSEAAAGDRVEAGRVLIAPGDRHTLLERNGCVRLADSAPVNGCRPSADVTLQSAVPVFGGRLTLLVMTGMGKDGALGAAAVKAARGRIFAQDQATSVVYGMPKAVVEAGLADEQLALDAIAPALVKHGRRVAS